MSTGATITSEPFGTFDGTPVERWTLSAAGTRVRVLTYGGIVQSIEVPDRNGAQANVALGLPHPEDYAAQGWAFFGALIGRYANRIGGASFPLDGHTYRLRAGTEPHCLHGGERGFDQRIWAAEAVEAGAPADGVALALSRVSPDGEEGFPGELAVRVTYTVTEGSLRIDYEATTDAPTVVGLTNHTYVNLDGEGSGNVESHELRIAAEHYTVNDATSLPTGEVAAVAGGPFDFRTAKPIGRDLRSGHPQLLHAHGYDQNFVLDKGATATPEPVAEVHSPASGRVLTLSTTAPGMQLYTANFFTPSFPGLSGRAYRQGDGLALEPQAFPDAPNKPEFPSAVLRPGETYRAATVYAFTVR